MNENEDKELKMGELFKTQHTIDEMLDRMGVKMKRKRAVVQWY